MADVQLKTTHFARAERLRRCATRAKLSNAYSRTPLLTAPAYAFSTAYLRGQVVSNSNNWYVCTISGTSAASGGPTTVNTGVPIVDGTVSWTWLGSARSTADDADAPVISIDTSVPGGLIAQYNPIDYPACYTIRGGYPTVHRTSYWQGQTYNQRAGVPTTQGISFGFRTDAQKFSIFIPGATFEFRVKIDGRYLTPGAYVISADRFLTFDYTGKGGRKLRSIELVSVKSSAYFGGVRVSTIDRVLPLEEVDPIRAVFIADSILGGSGPGPWIPGNQVALAVADLLGWSDPWSFATGGTGYVWPGATGFENYTFGERVPEALTRNPDVWVFAGSINDMSLAGVQAAALATYQAIRAGGSTAPIIVIGLWSHNNAQVGPTEASVAAAVAQFADPLGRTYFIPVFADPTGPWVMGSWNNTGYPNTSNSALMISTSDNTHPTELGTMIFSERIADAIRKAVLPVL